MWLDFLMVLLLLLLYDDNPARIDFNRVCRQTHPSIFFFLLLSEKEDESNVSMCYVEFALNWPYVLRVYVYAYVNCILNMSNQTWNELNRTIIERMSNELWAIIVVCHYQCVQQKNLVMHLNFLVIALHQKSFFAHFQRLKKFNVRVHWIHTVF